MKKRSVQFLGLISNFAFSTSLLVACGEKFNVSLQGSHRPPVTSNPLESEEQGPVLQTDSEQESFHRDLFGEGPRYSEEELANDAETQYQKNQTETHNKEPEESPAPNVTPRMKSQFCESLDVEDGKGPMDLSELYNEDTPLANSMPSNELKNMSSSEAKKNKFACILLPISIRMNEQVYRQRIEILRLVAKKKTSRLTPEDQKWLDDMKVAYSLKIADSEVELLKRVDIIPLPLLLAQAALESGWGRSPAAGKLNNLFGIHAYGHQPCERNGNGACIRKYKTLPEGVAGYISLLNSGRHYVKFREARHKMRQEGKALSSLVLIKNLGAYNATPGRYEKQLTDIMAESNKLTQFVFQEEEVKPQAGPY